VVKWVGEQGLTVTDSNLQRRTIQFSASGGQAEQIFGTSEMLFGNGNYFANVTEPQIPARFKEVIGTISGLDNFATAMPAGLGQLDLSAHRASSPTVAHAGATLIPAAYFDSGPQLQAPVRHGPRVQPAAVIGALGPGFGPNDFYTFYNAKPLLDAGIDGAGTACIATVEDSNLPSDVIEILTLFNQRLGLPAQPGLNGVIVSSSDPGVNGDGVLALADLEWSHAVAPGAAQTIYIGNIADGGSGIAIANALNSAVVQNTCSTVGIGYIFCGGSITFFKVTLDGIYKQGATQGQTIASTTGSFGAAANMIDPTDGR
jgi:subtilase family serine protease